MESNAVETLEKRRIPKSAMILLFAILLERYATVGIGCKDIKASINEFNVNLLVFSAVLLLFFNLKLGYSENVTTAIYHSFNFLSYGIAFIGGIIADSWLGNFKTIVFGSTIYTIGALLLAVSSVDSLPLPI